MEVLFVNVGYLPLRGGAELHIKELAERLVDEGHPAAVLTTDAAEVEHIWLRGKKRVAAAQEVIGGVEVRRFPVRHLPLLPYSYNLMRFLAAKLSKAPVDTTSFLSALTRLTPWVPDLERYLANLDRPYNVVHAWNIAYEPLIRAAALYAYRQGVPLVITPLLHLGEPESDEVRRFYTMRHQLALLRQSDAVIVNTEIERDFLAMRGIDIHRIHVIGPGVTPEVVTGGDADRFRAHCGVERPFVLYLGLVNYDKGGVHTVEAMRGLWREGLKADLVIAGTILEPFRSYWETLPAADRRHCHLLGPIDEGTKRDALAAASVLSLPSRLDSFGMVYLEAWANGLPVVGAQAGGVPAVIADGEDGYLVPFGDVDALADRLARLLADQALARRLGASGRHKVLERYTWERAYAATRAVYEKVSQ